VRERESVSERDMQLEKEREREWEGGSEGERGGRKTKKIEHERYNKKRIIAQK